MRKGIYLENEEPEERGLRWDFSGKMVETEWKTGSGLGGVLTYKRESSFPETRPKTSILKNMIAHISQP